MKSDVQLEEQAEQFIQVIAQDMNVRFSSLLLVLSLCFALGYFKVQFFCLREDQGLVPKLSWSTDAQEDQQTLMRQQLYA